MIQATQEAGVYEIVNVLDGKRYIGSTKNLLVRLKDHHKRLRHNNHPNPRLQHAWNKHGADAFRFLPILTCVRTKQMLMFYEQQLMDKTQPEYNLVPKAWTQLGAKRSDESRQRMSDVHKGKPVAPRTPEMNAAISARMMGHPNWHTEKHTDEARAKISASHVGRVYAPPTAETRAKLSKSNMGKHTQLVGVPWTPANRAAHESAIALKKAREK